MRPNLLFLSFLFLAVPATAQDTPTHPDLKTWDEDGKPNEPTFGTDTLPPPQTKPGRKKQGTTPPPVAVEPPIVKLRAAPTASDCDPYPALRLYEVCLVPKTMQTISEHKMHMFSIHFYVGSEPVRISNDEIREFGAKAGGMRGTFMCKIMTGIRNPEPTRMDNGESGHSFIYRVTCTQIPDRPRPLPRPRKTHKA